MLKEDSNGDGSNPDAQHTNLTAPARTRRRSDICDRHSDADMAVRLVNLVNQLAAC